MNDQRAKAAEASRFMTQSIVIPSLPGMFLLMNFGFPLFLASVACSVALMYIFERSRALLGTTLWYRAFVTYFFVSPIALATIKQIAPARGDLALAIWAVVSVAVVAQTWARWLHVMRSL